MKLKRFREVNLKVFRDEGEWAFLLLPILSAFCSCWYWEIGKIRGESIL